MDLCVDVLRVAVRPIPHERLDMHVSMYVEATPYWWILQSLPRPERSGVAHVLPGMCICPDLWISNMLFLKYSVLDFLKNILHYF